ALQAFAQAGIGQPMAPPTGQPLRPTGGPAVPPPPAGAPARPLPATTAGPQASPQKAAGPPTGAPKAPERSSRIGMSQGVGENDLDLESALRKMIELGASDLHLTS